MDYKDTLCLPKTEFPMKAKLVQKEPEILQRWEKEQLYHKIIQASAGRNKFILHDGPPYANGNIHLGTALNKILKDIIVKSLFMMGNDTLYLPGWDCHGLPIEHQVEISMGEKIGGMSKAEIRKHCRAYAEKYLGIQREEFKRLGVLGLWEDPYVTMSYGYEATIVRELGKFIGKGALYKARKPVYWCATCQTALAEAEVEYNDQTTPAIFVRFKMISDISEKIPELKDYKDDAYVVIWTTTPWTIPANLAVAFHPELDYAAVKTDKYGVLVMASDLVYAVMPQIGVKDHQVLATFKGSVMEHLKARHPLYDRESLLILAPFVTLDAGSGCVHIAPGHGEEDYEIGKVYGLDIYAPVDNEGKFTNEVEEFAGRFVFDANDDVNKALAREGALLAVDNYDHSYPYCWRCKSAIIFRSTNQWFISMEHADLRKKALQAIQNVRWIPSWGKDRIYGMVENRPDWCISRQRAWGVPIPVFYCKNCSEVLASQAVAEHVAKLFEKEGADAWFTHPDKDLLPEGTTCPHCSSIDLVKEEDIVDVWFDSGVSYAAVCENDARLGVPVDMYLEGSDQHRGWFHSTLLTSVGTRGEAPYKTVLTHGFVVDGEGRKMSKSLGNTIAPQEIIDKYGAEILRLWVSAQDFRNDIRISSEIVERLVETYRRIRNTARFMLGNLSGFNPDTDMVPYDKMLEMDRYALHVTQELIEKVRRAYEEFEPYVIYQLVHNFCVVDMSAFYLDVLKDRLYVYKADSMERRSAQSALFRIVKDLTRLLAPVLAFTAEEIWDHIPAFADKEESVHLTAMPESDPKLRDEALKEKWGRILALKQEVSKVLEVARREKVIGHPLDADVRLRADGETLEFLMNVEPFLEDVFICSKVGVSKGEGPYVESEIFAELGIEAVKAPGAKCPRCWHYREDIGSSKAHPDICRRCAEQLA
ncbi:MAG TPA: isoleucine--tRNA ligase [Deltaproteobacteria bacterium]|nr:isoleucine--tRNA ligase [Deltaproteobacteria bacterium]HXK46452.1 isoleucine--tRNA ligase [Deltaproteobacteria bacterium]